MLYIANVLLLTFMKFNGLGLRMRYLMPAPPTPRWNDVAKLEQTMDIVGLLSCLLTLIVSAQLGETAQCLPDSKNLCGAMCNGTSFDLSKAFDFP